MSDLHFPEELRIEILIRLPVKSLLRFTAVSKSWFFFITSPAFVSAHLRHSRNHNASNSRLLLRRYENSSKKEKYAILNDTHHQRLTLTTSSEFVSPVACRIGYLRAVGCCNGVICLSDDLYSDSLAVTLWNPSIRKLMTLPPHTVRPASPFKSVLGFGVSPQRVHDLKVVRVVYERKGEFLEMCDAPPEVEIYSLSTGLWRRIPAIGVNYFMIDYIWSQTFVNGAVHWIGCKWMANGRSQVSIAVFNMTDELFSEIMLPDELAEETASQLCVMGMALDESIAVVNYVRRDHECTCEVWIMKEYGVVESWSKLHSIDMVGGMEKVVGFRKNGEVLFSTKTSELVSYCPNTQAVTNLGIFGTSRSFYTGKFLESLVLLQEQSCFIEGLSQEMTNMSI